MSTNTKVQEGKRPASRPTCGNDDLAARLDAIEARLSIIERCPAIVHQVRMVTADDRRFKLDREEAARAKAARDETAGQRAEHFAAFAQERLLLGDGYRSQEGHLFAAYHGYCDEHELGKLDRYTEQEFFQEVCSLNGVTEGIVRSPVGGRLSGLHNIAVASQWAHPLADPGDEATQAQTESRRSAEQAPPVDSGDTGATTNTSASMETGTGPDSIPADGVEAEALDEECEALT